MVVVTTVGNILTHLLLNHVIDKLLRATQRICRYIVMSDVAFGISKSTIKGIGIDVVVIIESGTADDCITATLCAEVNRIIVGIVNQRCLHLVAAAGQSGYCPTLELDVLEVVGAIVVVLIYHAIDNTLSVHGVSPCKTFGVVLKRIQESPGFEIGGIEIGVA